MDIVFSKWVFAFSLSSCLIFSIALSVEGLHGDSKVKGVNLGGWLVIEGWIKPSLFDGIPNGDMLDGTQVQLKSITLQKFVSAESGGGTDVSVTRDVASSWETFTLWRVSESEFQFRTSQGQFLTCDGEGCSVSATATSPSTPETFKIERNNDVLIEHRGMGAHRMGNSGLQPIFQWLGVGVNYFHTLVKIIHKFLDH